MAKIGMLTIGQSPREDLLPILKPILGEGVEVLEAGALDGLTKKDVEAIQVSSDDYILVTRLRDGSEVKVTKRFVVPRMQERLEELEARGVTLTVVMCTGRFPPFKSRGLVVTPSEALRGVVEACLKEGRLAVVYPTQEQTVHAEKEFSRPGVQVYADSVSPYTEGDVDGLVDRLRGFDPHLVFLNCFGFPLWLKERIKGELGRPVLHSSSVVARIVKELI